MLSEAEININEVEPEDGSTASQQQDVLTFTSVLHQREDGALDASQLYADIEDATKQLKEMLSVDNLGRHHPLQHVLNSTSGNYVSPTAMKSFELCPAGYLAGKLYDEKKGNATSVGRSFHTTMERFYNLDGSERTKEVLLALAHAVAKEDQQDPAAEADIVWYAEQAWDTPDYDNSSRQMDHGKVQCGTEIFIKPTINPLGVPLGVPVYTLVDRIDVQNGIVVIDYKTGKGNPTEWNLGIHGYLPQMIFYKWAVEEEYGEKVRKALLSLPGADRCWKWAEMDVNSLVNQSIVVEQVYGHLVHVRKCRETKVFEASTMRYCGSCPIKWHCRKWLEMKFGAQRAEQDALKEIPINIKVEKRVYNPDQG